MDMNDGDLLNQYVEKRCEASFRQLVERHVNLVFSAALRQVGGDRSLAEDVTQMVFNDLARKAGSLRDRPGLAGWLYASTRFAAAKAVRTEARRARRQQEAFQMQESGNPSEPSVNWDQLEKVLDEAMHDLPERDRDAVLLRFFQGQPFAEVGASLGVSADSARMRVDRALEKLRKLLGKRGIVSTTSALAALLSQNALAAAPAGFAATVAGTAFAGAVGASSALTLLGFMAATKLKLAAIGLAAAGLTVPLVLQYQTNQALRRTQTELRQSQAELAGQIDPLKRENQRLNALLAERQSSAEPSNELFRLRAEVTRLKAQARETARAEAIAAATPGQDPLQETLRMLGLRAADLKNRLAHMPDKTIPELQFLEEKDWLDAVADVPNLQSDEEYRQALNALRARAKGKLGSKFQDALRQFAQAHGDQLPSDLTQLQPYFEPPLDPTVLQRYQLVQNGSYSQAHEAIISEIAPPVDEEYDSRFAFHRNGTSSTSYSRTGELLERAAEAFARANNGYLPKDPFQLTGYLPEPVDPARVQKFLAGVPPNIHTLEELRRSQN